MEQTVSATEARVHFGELLRIVVEKQQSIMVERSGKPLAVLIPAAVYEQIKGRIGNRRRRTCVEQILKISAAVHRRRRRPLTAPAKVLRESREERDANLR
jgi:prevent-host-death family protein